MKQYMKLLMARESREVLGRNGAHLWLMALMLVATFASIAFSEGSMRYLRYKMEDPYTNWVNISKANDDQKNDQDKFNKFIGMLKLTENKERYDYRDILASQHRYFTMISPGDTSGSQFMAARFFESLQTPLIDKVLEEDNVVEGCRVNKDLIDNQTMGLIITKAAAIRLGFTDGRLPAYIARFAINKGADSLGLTISYDGYYPVALPVLAVVHQLPNNVGMLSGTYLFSQLQNVSGDYPFDFNIHHKDYLRQLAFFVADDVEDRFRKVVEEIIPDSLRQFSDIILNANDQYKSMRSWKPGNILQVCIGTGETSYKTFQNIANSIEKQFPDTREVCRVFDLNTKKAEVNDNAFFSVEFNSLKQINEFEEFAASNGIQMEMEKVRQLQNFHEVTTMAGILSAAMVIFSIVCIIMFMVNMLQGYFQKVKRNIGTFKAFGMNGRELIEVYIIILVAIVLAAVIMALLITWGIQGILPVLGGEKDGFNYLSLWNTTTYIATAVIFVSTVATVILVMTRLLSQTPGDLIYDRN